LKRAALLAPESTAVATEASGTPGRALLAFALFEPGPVGAATEQGCIKNLAAEAPSNLNVALEDSAIRQMMLRKPPGGVKGLATRTARAADAGLKAAAQKMTCSRCTRGYMLRSDGGSN
jgi:hypothetical protein